MFTVTLKGATETSVALDKPPAVGWPELTSTVYALAIKLQARVVQGLKGEYLQSRSGALARSIQEDVAKTDHSVTGRVFSAGDVKYAAIQERGGTTPPHDIFPSKAQALHFMGGGGEVFAKVVHHPGSRIPASHFMTAPFEQMGPEITKGMKAAVIRDYQKALGQA